MSFPDSVSGNILESTESRLANQVVSESNSGRGVEGGSMIESLVEAYLPELEEMGRNYLLTLGYTPISTDLDLSFRILCAYCGCGIQGIQVLGLGVGYSAGLGICWDLCRGSINPYFREEWESEDWVSYSWLKEKLCLY